VQDEGEPSRAGGLLVGVRRHEQIAREPDPEPRQNLGGERHAGDAALHVAGPAPVELAVTYLRLERVARPLLEWLVRHGVDVTVEDEASSAALAGEARDELGAAVEPHPGWVQRLAVEIGRVGLEELGLGSRRLQPSGEMLLQGALLSGRIGRVPRGGVEADQPRGQFDELALAASDLGDDLLLERGERHAGNLSAGRRRPSVDEPPVRRTNGERVAHEAAELGQVEELRELRGIGLRIDSHVEVDRGGGETETAVGIATCHEAAYACAAVDPRLAGVEPEALQRAASDRGKEKVLRLPLRRKLDRRLSLRVHETLLVERDPVLELLVPRHAGAP
jgi:hypothetical protein